MSLKAVLENLDDVPEALHGEYEEKDGKFYLKIDGVDDHPSVLALKNALERQKTDRRKLADELKLLKDKYKDFPEDMTVDEFNRLKTALEEAEADPNKKKQLQDEAVAARKMLEQKIAAMEKKHGEEVAKLMKNISGKDAFIAQLLIEDGLTKALIDAGVSKEFLKASKALLAKDVKVVEEDGEYHAIVTTDTGDLDIPEYVQDWVSSDEGKVFVAPAKGGDAGGGGGGGGGKPPPRSVPGEKNPWAKESWNLTQQGKMLKEDRVKADKLAKAAGKTIPAAPPVAA